MIDFLFVLKKVIKKINLYFGWVDVVIDVIKFDLVYYWVVVINIYKYGWKEF